MVWRFLKRSWHRMFLDKCPKPPYSRHVVQVGDPVLRTQALPVPLDKINTEELQNVRIIGKHNYSITFIFVVLYYFKC